jgi:hypothetical protein
MNCGWATLIDEEQLKMMQEGMKEPVEATICDKQWEIICKFMLYSCLYSCAVPLDYSLIEELKKTLRKELAAIHVRSSHSSQPNVSGVSEGSNLYGDAPPNKTPLDLEQGS